MRWALVVVVAVVAMVVAFFAPKSGDADRRGTQPVDPRDPGVEALLAAFEPYKRTAFDPVTRSSDADGPVSKFGGEPWLPEESEWPECPGCKTPMHFFAQLDVASLPKGTDVVGEGLIQLFMCTSVDDDICLETWKHGSPPQLVRLVDSTAPGANSGAHASSRTWPARRIVDWKPLDDWPNYGDWDSVGLELSDELEATFEKVYGGDTAPYTQGGDKVGGWPLWIQSAEWGKCSECDTEMHLVLQIDSEDNVPFMFGDSGVGHICQCPKHPARLTWGWACH